MCTTSEDESRTTTIGTTGEEEEEEVPISPGIFNINPTIETTTATSVKDKEVCATSEDGSRTTIICTTGEIEEVLIPPGMFNIDNEFTTSNTTEEDKDEKRNNYYDNIDKEISRNEESTIVFEDNSFAPTTVTNKKKEK